MKKYLIPMTDFVLEIEQSEDYKNWQSESDEWFNRCENYSKFLKQPLKLEMFVPCDDYGNVLEEPKTTTIQDANFNIDEIENWNKAKEKVLFEGFRVVTNDSKSHPKSIQFKNILNTFWFLIETNSWHLSKGLKIIEDLIKFELELTESAIKQIYG